MTYSKADRKVIEIEGAEFQFKPNFSGDPEMNFDGRDTTRHFALNIADNTDNMTYCGRQLKIDDLIKDGWNVKKTKNEEDPEYYIDVKVSYRKYPPAIEKRTTNSKAKVLLTEDTVGSLDSDNIVYMDIVVSGSAWGDNFDRIKGYVSVLYVTTEGNRFASKYNDEEPVEDDNPFVE